jgi:RNA polymerase sigma factor (sigma-70 family)
MYNRRLPGVIRHLRQLVGAETAGNPIDRELLERFATGREEAAFRALVERHGPMVLGVCRRVLQDPHAAEDAFQATFLVLIRKAASLDRRGSLGGWLYTVAYRLALRARADVFRRRLRERPLQDVPSAQASSPSLWWELRPILDEELNRLPDKYRTPIVLCYLEGKTNEQVAQQLGCPSGTVSSRLARARDLLRGRLARRGLALSSGLFVTALTETAGPATVTAAVVDSTFQAALAFAAGPTPAGAPPAAVLAEGMLRGAFVARLRSAAVVVLVAGALSTATGVGLHRALANRPPVVDVNPVPAPQPPTVTQEAGDPECNDPPRLPRGPVLVARPEAFPTLVSPECSHGREEARRRGADLMAEDPVLCWVRGPYDGGAIPLRFFLNTHRVISDKYGVFVHDPDAGYARGFAPSLDFRFHGWRNGVLVLRHKDGTLYSGLSGRAFDGPRKGSRLEAVPTLMSAWGSWLQRYPEGVVYRMDEKYQPVALPTTVHADSCHSRGPADRRLASTTPVLGVVEGEQARAYPLDRLAAAGLLRDTVAGRPRVLLWDPTTRTAAAYRPEASPPAPEASPSRPLTIACDRQGAGGFIDRETGSRWDITGRAVEGALKGWTLTWLDGVQVKWFAWAAEYPETSLFGR